MAKALRQLLTSAIYLLICSWSSDCGAGQVSFPLYVKNVDWAQLSTELMSQNWISLLARPTYE